MPLTDTAIRQSKPGNKPFKTYDRDGLFLLVNPSGSKLWRWRYRVDGKEKLMALGEYPVVSLGTARELHLAARRVLASGTDPMAERRAEAEAKQKAIQEKQRESERSFEKVARTWWEWWSIGKSPRHAETVMNRLEADVFPAIGHLFVDKVEPGQIRDVLLTIETRGASDVAKRAHQRHSMQFVHDPPGQLITGRSYSLEEGKMHVPAWRCISLRTWIACAPFVLVVGGAMGQGTATHHDLRFEVASIRPVDPPGLNRGGTVGPAYTLGHYREERIYLGGLIAKAFNVTHAYQIRFPSWMASAWFSVNATLPENATQADLPFMLRHLLEDRFGIRYHYETVQMEGYELVAEKTGPKVTKTMPAANTSAVKDPMAGIEFKGGNPVFGKDAGYIQLYRGSTAWWHGRNETMQKLASDISTRLKVPVADATGLEGGYDFTLIFSVENSVTRNAVSPLSSQPTASPSEDGLGASTPTEYPPLADVLRHELGLELKPVKNLPVDVLVVDDARRTPTEN